MRVLVPITFDVPTMVVSSSAAAELYADWSSTATYVAQDNVTYLGRYWESQTFTTAGEAPVIGESYPWIDIGPANKDAMFDSSPTTITYGSSPLTVVVTPGAVNAAAFFNVTGTSLSLTGVVGTSTTYSKTVDVSDVGEAVVTDIPSNASLQLTIALSGTGTGTDAVSIGAALFGADHDLGTTQVGASASIIDYSTKQTDQYGDTIFVQRGFAKTLTCETLINNTDLNAVMRVLSSLRATPTVWIASTKEDFSAIGVVYGYYRDFSVDVRYPTYSLCSLEIEGLV